MIGLKEALNDEAHLLGLRDRKMVPLEGKNVFEPIDDPATEFDVGRAFSLPAPPFKRAVADIPPTCQVDLIEVLDGHLCRNRPTLAAL